MVWCNQLPRVGVWPNQSCNTIVVARSFPIKPVCTKTMHCHDESFQKRPVKLAESGEEPVVWACQRRTANPSNQTTKQDFFEIAPFSVDRTYYDP